MMILALLAATTAQPPETRVAQLVEATATVRIIAGKRMTLGTAIPEAELRQTRLRDLDGQVKPAHLIEFQ